MESVTRYLGELAMALRDRPDAALERLRDLEIVCLVHHWTNTSDVVPREIVQALVASTSLAEVQAKARAWRMGPPPPPRPRYEDQPEVIARRKDEEARQQAAAEAEAARRASLTPYQRAVEEAESARMRLSLHGLIRRPVH